MFLPQRRGSTAKMERPDQKKLWTDRRRMHFQIKWQICSLRFRGGKKLGGNDTPVIFQETENSSTDYDNEITERKLKAASGESALDDREC